MKMMYASFFLRMFVNMAPACFGPSNWLIELLVSSAGTSLYHPTVKQESMVKYALEKTNVKLPIIIFLF